MNQLFISNALLRGKSVDILITGATIGAVAPHGELSIPEGATFVDASGQIIFPSFYDCHVHLREPGYEYKEDIESGLRTAAHGGFCGVMAMANTNPTNDSASVTEAMLLRAQETWPNGPHLYPVGAATIGLKGKELAPMGELAESGCVAISNDGVPVGGAEMFRHCMEYAATYGLTIIDHCEDATLANDCHMNEGSVSDSIGVKGQPVVAESMQVARDILLAEYLELPVHIAHVSCKQSVELIRWAKARGVKVTAETCPHYLLLTDEVLDNYSTAAKVNPPLRKEEDRLAMKEAVKDGTIDIFVTDHAPHADHEKEHPIEGAPNGISGMDSAVALTWTQVDDGTITEDDFIKLWSERPAEIFKLPHNSFVSGDIADFFLFDPKEEWMLTTEAMHSKGKNTPFLNRSLKGRVKAHWIGGIRVA